MYYNKYRLLFTGAGSYDADAQTYFTAAGITDAGHKSAWNTFVLDCKANGNWTPLIAAYPVIGGSSGSHAVNAKTPGTYNLSFTGITHSSSGIQGNGTTNVVDTGIQVSTSGLTSTDIHLCFYTSTNSYSGATVADIGAFNSTYFVEFGVYGGSPNSRPCASLLSNANLSSDFVSGTPLGVWYTEAASSTSFDYWKNTTQLTTVGGSTGISSAFITGTIKLTARTNNAGTVSRRSSKTYGFFSIGGVLGDVAAFTGAISTLQAALGR